MDRDLAALYDVETSQLNRQVKHNIQRFPEDFMFQLTSSFWNLRVKILRRSFCLSLSIALAKSLNDWRLTSVNI